MGIIIIIMKLLALIAAAVAFSETELRAMTPNQRAIETSVRTFAKKMAALKAAIKLQKTQDDRIRKAFFKTRPEGQGMGCPKKSHEGQVQLYPQERQSCP